MTRPAAGAATHARLTELFAEAIALPAGDRTALLARLRVDDPALAGELEALLRADASAETALDTGGLVMTADLRKPRGLPYDRTPAIPGYRLAEILGEGGMGTVYAAEQQAPRRQVAIKVLNALSQSALGRFRTEAEVMARLDHPGIARVLQAGEADGHPFLVMEHVDGVTLDQYVAALPRARRLQLFAALCDAVHHAHVKGVIHRDLKPSNVMVRPGDRVVVLDFGVARMFGDDGSASGTTSAGELIGTPLYMSPEQARLRPNEVDARSDVYTLGVMLYELACGELPYDIRGVPLPGVALAIVEDEPIPLAKRDPSLGGDLEAVVMKALRKDPTERYQSAAALGDDVRRWLAGLPVSVRTPGSIEQLGRFVRRRPLIAGGIASALIATATFAIVVTRLWLAASAARAAAEQAQHRTEQARAELEVRTNELTLRQARAAVVRDPTEAIAWLATLVASRSLDPDAAWGIVDEALGRGVASQVLDDDTDEIHWVEPIAGGGDFVTAAYDGQVIVWQAPAFAPKVVFRAAHGRVHVARPSPDGTQLAIGADDGQLQIITRDGAVIAKLEGHAGDVQHMSWSPDGTRLATSDDHGNVWLWARDGGHGVPLATSGVSVGALEWAADGSVLVAGNHAGALWRWNADGSGLAEARLDSDIVDVWASAERIIVIDATGAVRTFATAGGKLVVERTVATHQPTKRAMFAAGGAWVVLGGVSGTAVRVEGDTVEPIARHRAQVRYIAISADGNQVATASDDGQLQVVDRATGRHSSLRGHAARIRHIAFAGKALLSVDGEGVVRRWLLDPAQPRVLDGTGAPVARLAAAADGSVLASLDTEGQLALWSLADGGRQLIGKLAGHASALALAGRTIITGSAEGEVAWWGGPAPVVHGVPGIVRHIAISASRVAVATGAGPIELFTLAGEPAGELAGNTRGTEAVAFDPRGALLAAGGQDRVIRVYRASGGTFTPIAELAGPTGDTHFVTWSTTGDRLITAGNDGVVYAWRVANDAIDPASRVVLVRHTGAISGLAVSRDGRWLASGARDDQVMRVALAGGAGEPLETGGAASAIAFDAGGGIQAVTRTGQVVHGAPRATAAAMPSTAAGLRTAATAVTVIDHGAIAGVPVGTDRLAVALDDGAIVIEQLGPHTLDELTRAVTAATAYRLPASVP
ncbi:MAG TPA: WD40 repeat domain-containing serine/threonine-protein kinase [Kofleriaceae bacterium]